MTNELEPCPFKNNGKAHSPRLVTAMGEAWVLCSCGTSGKEFSGIDAEEKAIEFWNDRYKRTCKMVECSWDNGACTWGCKCSACGDKFEHTRGSTWKHCPSCGAEVAQ